MVEKYMAIPVIAVYSKFMPNKSQDLRTLFKKAKVQPFEEHLLENYVPDDSPEDVGFHVDGEFVNWEHTIGWANNRYWKNEFAMMRQESIKKQGLEQVIFKP
tara:strand:+ start:1406 stop:1711 length:306 start_codon:yes stop_codon:yes gene_type:complete